MGDLGVASTPGLFFQREGHWQRQQRQSHADGVPGGEDAKEHIGDKEQEVVEDVGQRGTYEDGQGDYAGLLVGVHVSCVVAMENGFCVEGERDGVDQRQHRQVAHLHGVGEHDGQRAECDEDHDVSQRNVLEADAWGTTEGKKTGRSLNLVIN